LRGVLSLGGGPPDSYCYNCGKPYPWTEESLKAIDDLINMSTLNDSEKEDFKQAVTELTKDTPKAKVATQKFKIYSAKVGKQIGDAVKEITINIAAEAIKKILLA
jgi:hypothetical protein